MHHVMALITERQKGTRTKRSLSQLLSVMCFMSKVDTKLLSSRASHWKEPLYSYGVEVRLSTSYPPQTLPLLCYWSNLLSMMMMMFVKWSSLIS
ncbi:hypothetical protein Hanom_Chr04g00333101 [Helianthus anomalus]